MEQLAEKLRKTTVRRNYSLMTAILVWCGLVVVSSLYITIPMVSIFTNEFKVTPSQAAWTGSAFSFAYACGFLFFGPLSEKYGRKQMMVLGLIALCIVTPILGMANGLSWLIVLRAMQGIAAATFAPAALSYVVEMYPIEKRVTAIGVVSTGFLMAGIIGQVVSSLISQHLGWSYVFYFLGGIYLLSAILLGLLPNGEIQQQKVSVLTILRQMSKIFFQKSIFFCYVTTVTLLLSFVGMYTALGNLLSQPPFELNNNQILMIRAVGIFGMLLSPFTGRFSARFGIKSVLQAGLILAVLGLGIVGISSSLPVLIFMSVVFVAGISITVPTLISWIGSLGGSARGIAVTLYTFILFIGATLGPIVALNLLKSGSYMFTFEGLTILLVVGLLSTLLVRNPNTD